MMMMSDGALSQAEIDALLSGVDSGAGGATTAVASGSFSGEEQKALEDFFNTTSDAQSANLSKLMGATVSLKDPKLTVNGRDVFLEQLSETVTVVKADFNSGFPGEHIFIIPEEGAKAIAGLMTKEENIQLDEMAMSVIGEVVSQMVGHQITTLTNKTGNQSIATVPPEASNVPKAVVALPAGDFVGITYQVDLGDGKEFAMWEVLGPSAALEIAKGLTKKSEQPQKKAGGAPGLGGMNMAAMGMGGGMGGGGFGQANVQSVQFPNLMPHGGPQEAGNIGLIMDVYMEMTVELGRTRKLIKEILAMGEGTIIELDKLAGEPVDILVNHKLIAKGEVVVIDENFGVRVTEIVSPMERMSNMD
jgi:flagellar motor switch protein FliN/FliY